MKNLHFITLILASVILLPFNSHGQGALFESIIEGGANNEHYYDVAIDGFGTNTTSLYVGYGVIDGTADIIVVKKDNFDQPLWFRSYDSSGSEFGHRIVFTSDGGFAITGWTTVNGSDDLLVIKCDEDGGLEWTKAIGGSGIERGRDIRETPDGDLIVAGHTNTETMGVNDILVVKLDAGGGILWKNRYGGSGNENGWGVETLSDGSHVIAGNIGSVGPGFTNLALMKVEADGTLVWLRGFGSDQGATAATSMDIDEEDKIFVGGWTDAAGAGDRDAYAAVFNSEGNLISDLTVGGTGFETANDIDEYSAFAPDNMMLVGRTGSFDDSGNDLMQPFIAWLSPENVVEFFIAGSDIEDGELFGVEVNVPIDQPGVVTAGLSNATDTENINAYRFQGYLIGLCSEEREVQSSSPGFGFEEGGMVEVDESEVTEPILEEASILLDEEIDCMDYIGLDSEDTRVALTTYPNPAANEFRIEGCENTRYSVFDIHGKLAEQGVYAGRTISVSEWNQGIYSIQTENCGTGKVVVKR